MSARVFLVDASPYIFRAFFSLPSDMTDREGRPSGAIHGFTDFLLRILREHRPTHLELAFDFHLSRSFRNRFYPEYKAHRDAPPADLEAQVARCMDVAGFLGARTHIVEDYEADDIVGTLCHQLEDSDADLTLVSSGVSLLDFARGDLYGPAEVRTKFGVRPDQIVDYLGLAGDSVDNIPGVRGVGPKTAAALLGSFESLEEIYESIARVSTLDIRGAQGVARRLEAHRAAAFLSRRLATIALDTPIAETLATLELAPPNAPELRQLLDELESEGLAQRVEALLAG